ncbi:MAG: NUDIX hydrolase, partial [SAR324 cluster bacterium]|nr:NUDIX hydrolase [SAR324 cluster bacterium]
MRRTETVEAVSSVFFFQDQIFVVVRQNHLDAFPGYHAFPGGKIDSQDHESNRSSNFPELNPVHLSALHREMKEELDYDLQKGIAEGTISSIEPLAEIAAPSFAQIPFRNWFYRIDLKESPEFILDEGEFASGIWMTPKNLLQKYQEGEALMVPPLRRMIRLLHEDPQTTNLGDLSRKFDESQNIPELEMQEGVRILMIPSHTLPPAERTNAFRLGDSGSPQILVDPSPKSEEIYKVLLQQMKEENLDALFLTHHHPDHHQHAPDLARELSVPV